MNFYKKLFITSFLKFEKYVEYCDTQLLFNTKSDIDA